MPGIVGFFLQNDKIKKPKLLDKMISIVSHHDNYQAYKYHKHSSFAAALVSQGAIPSNSQPVTSKDGNYILLFDGELYNNYTTFSDAEYVLQLFEQDKNLKFLSDLEGIFSFVLYDEHNQNIYLISDKFGLKPLYYTKTKDGFLFSSEVKAFLCYPNISKKLDFEALAFLFHFGFVLGDKTLFEDIKLLPHASCLIYNIKDKKTLIKQYWDPLTLFAPKGSHKNVPDNEIIYLFLDAVKKRLKNKERLAISLSGGLDSRSILAALGKEARGMPSYTLGLKGCQDERLSAQMAQIAGTNHIFLPITEDDLRNFIPLARTLIFYSDGFYLPHESTEKVALNYFKRAPFKILFRGHGGEIAKASLAFPVQVDKFVLSINNFSDFRKILFKKTNLVLLDNHPKDFFVSNTLKKMQDIIFNYLTNQFSAMFDSFSTGDMFIFFYIFEHIRRQVVASLNIFRIYIETRLPFVDEKFLSLLLQLPIEQRYAGEIHFKIIKYTMPALIKVPNSNTGAPLDAGKLRLWFTDKFNSLLKKLSLPGFRHYTEFDKWQRKYFKQGIEQIIFDKKTLDRGIYNSKLLKNVFNDHISGRGNYARLLGTVVGIELWFREFVDNA